MKQLEERLHGLIRSFVTTNLSSMARNDGGLSTILGASELTGRLAVQRSTSIVASARSVAWAGLSVLLHQQMIVLASNVTLHYATKFKEALDTPDALAFLEQKITGATVKEWLIAQQLLETDRIQRVFRLSTVGDTPETKGPQLLRVHNPYGPTNSSVAALTVTASTHVLNQSAMDIARQLAKGTYRLWTSGDRREPDIYKRLHEVGKGPLGPMFVGDRTIPVLS